MQGFDLSRSPKSHISQDSRNPPSYIESWSNASSTSSGYCVWSWDAAGACWVLMEDKTTAGFEAGSGPTGPGRFANQVVRWAGRPSPVVAGKG